jgi:hypothetical protein
VAESARQKKPKTPSERWAELAPPERIVEYSKAFGSVIGQIVAVIVLLVSGTDVFLSSELIPFVHLDPVRAQDIFFGLCGYFGIPILISRVPHHKGH